MDRAITFPVVLRAQSGAITVSESFHNLDDLAELFQKYINLREKP